MKLSRRVARMMHEPPAIMLTDLAFNLLIFFVVCASTEPESGRKQNISGGSKDKAAEKQGEQNIEVYLTSVDASINGNITPLPDIPSKLKDMLKGKTKPEQRVVVVKTRKDTPYRHWIQVTSLIEEAGGVIAMQLEESKEVLKP